MGSEMCIRDRVISEAIYILDPNLATLKYSRQILSKDGSRSSTVTGLVPFLESSFTVSDPRALKNKYDGLLLSRHGVFLYLCYVLSMARAK